MISKKTFPLLAYVMVERTVLALSKPRFADWVNK